MINVCSPRVTTRDAKPLSGGFCFSMVRARRRRSLADVDGPCRPSHLRVRRRFQPLLLFLRCHRGTRSLGPASSSALAGKSTTAAERKCCARFDEPLPILRWTSFYVSGELQTIRLTA